MELEEEPAGEFMDADSLMDSEFFSVMINN